MKIHGHTVTTKERHTKRVTGPDYELVITMFDVALDGKVIGQIRRDQYNDDKPFFDPYHKSGRAVTVNFTIPREKSMGRAVKRFVSLYEQGFFG